MIKFKSIKKRKIFLELKKENVYNISHKKL